MSGFFYEYTFDLHRPTEAAPAGAGTYSGERGQDTLIGTGLAGSVQRYRLTHSTVSKLPGDAGAPSYNIVMPFSSVPTLGMVMERDILIDQLGRRFIVIDFEWTFLGFSAHCELLET